MIQQLWQDGETFLLVEHDIQLTALAVSEAVSCDCLWATNPYWGDGASLSERAWLTWSLGCVRFRAELMAEFPDAVNRANAIDDGGSVCPPGHWKRVDCRLMSVLRQEGYEPCVHSEVLHHHWYSYGCACGGDHE